MTDSSLLKNIAQYLVETGKVNETVEEYILKKLSRDELKNFLFYLKEALRKSRVTVISADKLDQDTKKKIETLYKKSGHYLTDESLSAGVIIKDGDDVYDASFKNMLNETINKLEN